jgi:hypothetical protein
MVRALFAGFSGALYSVVRSSDNTTRNISVAAPGGTAASAAQGAFCAGVQCVVEKIFDQSGNGNHLGIFGPDKGVNATRDRCFYSLQRTVCDLELKSKRGSLPELAERLLGWNS